MDGVPEEAGDRRVRPRRRKRIPQPEALRERDEVVPSPVKQVHGMPDTSQGRAWVHLRLSSEGGFHEGLRELARAARLRQLGGRWSEEVEQPSAGLVDGLPQ
jgi:hypothetical protein